MTNQWKRAWPIILSFQTLNWTNVLWDFYGKTGGWYYLCEVRQALHYTSSFVFRSPLSHTSCSVEEEYMLPFINNLNTYTGNAAVADFFCSLLGSWVLWAADPKSSGSFLHTSFYSWIREQLSRGSWLCLLFKHETQMSKPDSSSLCKIKVQSLSLTCNKMMFQVFHFNKSNVIFAAN